MVGNTKIHFGIDVVVPRIMEIGMKRLPKEACGVVIPDLNYPADDWVIELQNRAPDPTTGYDIDPAVIRSLVGTREVWEDVLLWHTHPSGHVGPSERDWRTRVPGVQYLVVALPRGEATLFRGEDV